MKVFKIKSDYECLVKINEKEVYLHPNETLELDEHCKVLIYPTSTNTVLPFSFDTKVLQDNKCYSFAELDQNTTLICLHNGSICENYIISKLNIKGSDCQFEVGENRIVVLYKNWKKIITLEERFDTFTTRAKDNIAYIKLKNNRKELIYAVNVNSGKLRAFAGKKIELLKDGFSIEKETSLKENYKITAEGLKLDTKEEASSNLSSLSNETTPYTFLDAIKQGKLNEAYTLCDETLQNKITKESLKNYFGYVTNFYYISPYKYAVQSENKLKTYQFEVQNKKIIDIDE